MNEKELRELDSWIAESIMGCKKVWILRDLKDFTFIESKDSGVLLLLPSSKNILPFKPTTDPAAAMMVLEKCCEQEKGTSIAIHKRGEWAVCSVGRTPNMSHAKTLPLAICLFAKKLFSPTSPKSKP